MIIQLAGLPGTGKSTIAAALGTHLNALVLDKDKIRQATFGPAHITYDQEQDDLCMQWIHQAAAWELRRRPGTSLILDGRTCLRRYQVRAIKRFATEQNRPLHIIECVCPEETALRRITTDTAAGQHPAANRTTSLYRTLRAKADPIPPPKLRVHTDQPLENCVAQVIEYVSVSSEE